MADTTSDRLDDRDQLNGDFDTRANGKSAGRLMKEVTEDLSTLIRKEIELAKQELGESIGSKLKGAALIGIAGVLAFFALIFVLLAIRDGLDTFMWTWVADIVTALILLAIGGAGALIAKKKLEVPISTELTRQSIKEDVEMAKSLGRK